MRRSPEWLAWDAAPEETHHPARGPLRRLGSRMRYPFPWTCAVGIRMGDHLYFATLFQVFRGVRGERLTMG